MVHATHDRMCGRFVLTALFLVVQAALCGTSQAQTLDYEVGVSVLHSDNIGLSETNPVSETVLSPRIDFEIEKVGSGLEILARGNFQYLDYLGNAFSDQPRGALSGQLNWIVSPERVNFVVEDYLSRQPTNVLTAFTPSNDQQVNVFIAGPSFFARLGGTTRGQLDVRYTNTYAEETTAFNGSRYNAAGRLLRQLRSTNWIGLNLETTRVDFDDNGTTRDYTRNDGYVSYVSNLSSVDMDLRAGYSRIELRNTGEGTSGPLLRAQIDWRASPRSVLTARANYEFADAADTLITDDIETPLVIGDITSGNVSVGPNVFRHRRYEIGYRFTHPRFSTEITAYREGISYLDNFTPDQTNRGAYGQLVYHLRPRTELSFTAARNRSTYDPLGREDEDSIAALALTQHFTRHWSGRVDLQVRERSSTEIGQSYDENAVIASVSYRR